MTPRKAVVLDTNVLMDLYVFKDLRTAALRSAIAQGGLDLLTCGQALSEFADVLSRGKFGLSVGSQQNILQDWGRESRTIADTALLRAPWRCKDKADQIFLDMAWTARPALLISKDRQVLRFAKQAIKADVRILSEFVQRTAD